MALSVSARRKRAQLAAAKRWSHDDAAVTARAAFMRARRAEQLAAMLQADRITRDEARLLASMIFAYAAGEA